MAEQIPQKNGSEVISDRDTQVNIMGVGAVQSEVFSRRSSLPRPSEDEIEETRAQLVPKASREYTPPTQEQIEDNKRRGYKATPYITGGPSRRFTGREQWAPDLQYHGTYKE